MEFFIVLYLNTDKAIVEAPKHVLNFWLFWYCYNYLFHAFCMLYHVWLCSYHPCDLTLILFFFITNYPFRKKMCQVINYNQMTTIEREQTFGKSSIRNQSSLSKIRNIWQDLNYYLTYSRQFKLVEIFLSVVRFCIVQFSGQVPTWWWSNFSPILIGTKGICIRYIDIVVHVGQ